MSSGAIFGFPIKLKTKLQLSFLLVGFLSVIGTGWLAFESARGTIESMTFDRLTSIRETKKRQIESYFQQVRSQVVTLSEDRMIVQAMLQFDALFHRMKAYQYASLAELFRSSDNQLSGVLADYFQLDRAFAPILQNYRRRFNYEDIFLIDVDSGFVVYSVGKGSDFATNLMRGPFRTTNLASVFREVKSTREPDFVSMVDFSPYAGSNGSPAAFIASPIYDHHKSIGVLVFEMATTLINRVMTSENNWRAEGLGATGETYIVGSDYRMRTDSRFFVQEPEEYFNRLEKIGTDTSLIRRIRSQKTSILLQEVHTVATADALRGNTDTKIIRDYRGIPVLSSYTPLTIPGVHWVMLAEIDTSEAFSSVNALREQLILLGLVILLLAALVGMLIARTISKPILSLAEATDRFGKGEHRFHVDVRSRDEIGMLATAFNRMAGSITEHTRELKNEINERCRAEEEVSHSHQRLRNLSMHLQTVREEERKSLAREIHDELGQALTTLKLNLALLQADAGDSTFKGVGKVASMLNLIDTTIRSVKRMVTALRPGVLDDLGLTAAIEWQAEEFQQRTGIACSVLIEPEEFTLDADRSAAVFRIFQETLTNIARHAKATSVEVHLVNTEAVLELYVRDDGIGIRDEQLNDGRSFGLIGIRERASYWGGTANIRGSMNEGTNVVVQLPHRREEHDD